MPDSGVPCQLDFFHDLDFSASPEKPTSFRQSHAAPVSLAPSPPAPAKPTISRDQTASITHSPFTASDLTNQAVSLISSLGIGKLARRVSVIWNRRMRTAAGRAFYEANRIELNPRLLSLDEIDVASEVDRTLRHELAHLVAFHRARGRKIAAHGNEWRQACADLGIPDESRCLTLPFEPRRVRKKLVYECPECDNKILRVRRFRQAVACYDCCRQHGDGRYDERFRLRARKLELT